MYKDNIKLFGQNEKELEKPTTNCENKQSRYRMEFSIEKCVMLVKENAKRHMTEGVDLPNQVVIRTLGEKETY